MGFSNQNNEHNCLQFYKFVPQVLLSFGYLFPQPPTQGNYYSSIESLNQENPQVRTRKAIR